MNVLSIKRTLVNIIPKRLPLLYMLNPKDMGKVLEFLFNTYPGVSFGQKLSIIRRLYAITRAVPCQHSQNQMVASIETVLSLPDGVRGCIVEAGCYKGGSTAKLSIAAKIANRELVVFDSFEGLPEHDEPVDKRLDWHSRPQGSFSASLNEVVRNVEKYGELEVCEFIKGWFEDTMSSFSKPVSAVFLDVNLASSTRTCIKYLYPLLVPGGTLYSSDGYSPLVCEVFRDDEFWRKEVGYERPRVEGLGKQKLLKIIKPVEFEDKQARRRLEHEYVHKSVRE